MKFIITALGFLGIMACIFIGMINHSEKVKSKQTLLSQLEQAKPFDKSQLNSLSYIELTVDMEEKESCAFKIIEFGKISKTKSSIYYHPGEKIVPKDDFLVQTKAQEKLKIKEGQILWNLNSINFQYIKKKEKKLSEQILFSPLSKANVFKEACLKKNQQLTLFGKLSTTSDGFIERDKKAFFYQDFGSYSEVIERAKLAETRMRQSSESFLNTTVLFPLFAFAVAVAAIWFTRSL